MLKKEQLIQIEHERISQIKEIPNKKKSKSKEQVEFLEAEFSKNPNWDHHKNVELAL